MARIARVVVPGIPHHITQRGNRRQETFFKEEDYYTYLDLMSKWCRKCQVEIWAYCLMPNHVHLIAVPKTEDGLRKAIGEAHRRYTRYINFQKGWRGHLWQERFASYPMDEVYLLAAVRYIENNPVRAKLSERPEEYRWSSARAHMEGKEDRLVTASPLIKSMVGDWQEFLSEEVTREDVENIQSCERTGRPLGDSAFVSELEEKLKRVLQPQRAGRKKKTVQK